MDLPNIGAIVADRYELVAILGEGGHGRVYRAHDRQTGRPVALKVSLHDDPRDRQRFEREGRLLRMLSSPHIAAVIDAGQQDTLQFAAFELVEGRDLADELDARGQLDEATMRTVLSQVLMALDEAHRAGLVHRDIKPENIRGTWSPSPNVKLLDFGIARPFNPTEQRVTKTGELIGTPRYMSPEQLKGEALGPTSDIYSLGMVAYEMLVGRAAMHGYSLGAQLERLRSGHLVGLPATADASAQIGQIITRMCSTKPQDRFPSAAAVLSALGGHVDTVDRARLQAKAPPRQRFSWKWLAPFLGIFLIAFVTLWSTRAPNDASNFAAERPSAPRLLRASEPAAPVVQNPKPDLVEVHNGTPGCGTPQQPGRQVLKAMFGNDEPTTVFIPDDYDPRIAHAVVFAFHTDQDGGANNVVKHLGLDELADEHDFIVVAPRGGKDVAWQSPSDVESAEADYELAMNNLCIDVEQIFVLGHGTGGRGVQWFLCNHPEVAAAATTAWVREREFPRCPDPHTVPTLHLATLKSGFTPPAGGKREDCWSFYDKLPLAEFEQEMRQLHRCMEQEPMQTKKDDATCYTWECETHFTSCHVNSGGLWPGAPNRHGVVLGIQLDKDAWVRCDGPHAKLDFGQQIWRFFQTRRVPGQPDAAANDRR